MNKQNKKIAQQKRAEERKKAEKRAAVIKRLKFWVPVIAVVIVVVVLVWAVATSGNGSSSSDTQSGTESTSTSTSAQDTQSTSESEKTLDKTEGVAAQNGDTVNIDYTGYLDGTAFKGGSTNGSGADLELGSGTYIDGFEDGIVGHTVGETFDLNLTFPETYPNNPDLAGKEVVFTVTLNGIYK